MRRSSPEAISPGQMYAAQPWSDAWSVAGITQLFEPMVHEQRKDTIRRVLAARRRSVTVLMDAPHDPHNGAAILRSADAFGLQEIHLLPREEEFLASNVVSKGTERWVDVVQHRSCSSAVDSLQSAGYSLVTTHPQGELVPEDLSEIERLCLVMGNEHHGVRRELVEASTQSVRIPMVGFVESLNVSVAAALLIRAACHNRPADLEAADFARLYARGLFRSVKRAREILAVAEPR